MVVVVTFVPVAISLANMSEYHHHIKVNHHMWKMLGAVGVHYATLCLGTPENLLMYVQ